jgi:hypothetical protein
MPTYLETHPPKVRQFRRPRRVTPSGLIVVHTAESALDMIGEDSGAEDVARFIANRSDYGSYHTLADTDSTVRLVPFDAEAFGDGTGSNPFAIHISFACKAVGWAGMSPERRAAMIHQGALAAAEAAKWLRREHGVTVPVFRISRADSERRLPGFISHADRDPARRSDPGAAFPWDAFFAEYVALMRPSTKPTRKAITVAIKLARKAGRTWAADRLRKIRDGLRP